MFKRPTEGESISSSISLEESGLFGWRIVFLSADKARFVVEVLRKTELPRGARWEAIACILNGKPYENLPIDFNLTKTRQLPSILDFIYNIK